MVPLAGALQDLQIRILPRREAGYPVEITLDSQVNFPRGYLPTSVLPWTPSGDRVQDGQRLFDVLFADPEVRRAWEYAKGQAQARRIRLWVDVDAPELHTLPWELLREEGSMLSANADTPFSRYLPVAVRWGGVVEQRPIRVLGVISSPHDLETTYNLPQLDVSRERSALQDVFNVLNPEQIKLDLLAEPVTLDNLEAALRDDYHILHYLGHGMFNRQRQQAALYLQDNAGNTRVITGELLCDMLLSLERRPRLIFLAACESATRARRDAFRGLAPQLVQAGVPAVVAMQGAVAIQSAREFSLAFYRRLVAYEGVVDRAMNIARRVLINQARADVGVPVLFMRLKSGQLWGSDVEPPPPPFVAPPLHTLQNFVGREAALSACSQALTPGTVHFLTGLGGVGKTALATQLAYALRRRFSDGVIWLSLETVPAPEEALSNVIRAYGQQPEAGAAAQVQRLLQDKRALLILDGAEAAPEAMQAVLQCAGSCAVLVTTRDRALARGRGLPTPLPPLPPPDARALLAELLGKSDPALAAIVERLGCLPLALKIAAGDMNATQTFPDEYLEDVQQGALALLPGVEAAFQRSYERLTAEAQRAFALVGLFGAETFDLEAVAAGLDASMHDARLALGDLVRRSLLERDPESRRYHAHPLLRDYAQERPLPEMQQAEARQRLVDHYLAYAQAHQQRGAAAYDALELERENILAAMDWVYEAEKWPTVAEFALTLRRFFNVRGYWREGQLRLAQGLKAGTYVGNPQVRAELKTFLGLMLYHLGEFEQAEACLTSNLQLSEDLGDRELVKRNLYYLGLVLADWGMACSDSDNEKLEQAIVVLRDVLGLAQDKELVSLVSRQQIAKCYLELGRLGGALNELETCLTIHEKHGFDNCRAYTFYFLGLLYFDQGALSEARHYYERALEQSETLGDQRHIAEVTANLAEIAALEGQCVQACAGIDRALALAERIGHQHLIDHIKDEIQPRYDEHCGH